VPSFKDCKGREWTFRLTVGSLAEVREVAGVDLGAALRSEGAVAELLFSNPETLVKVFWALLYEQARDREHQVDPETFARGFDGPALEAATEALLGAIADFFPRSRVGRAIRENLTQTLERMDQTIIEAMTSTSNRPAGNSPA